MRSRIRDGIAAGVFNPGSLQIGEEKVKMNIPRVMDMAKKQNVTLENYELLKELPTPTEELMDKSGIGIKPA